MGYEIIAVDPDSGASVATLETKIEHAAAHLLMGALGVDYDQDDEIGSGDSFKFTDAELSAAEAALTVVVFPENPDAVSEAMRFIADVRTWMAEAAGKNDINIKDAEVEIGFF